MRCYGKTVRIAALWLAAIWPAVAHADDDQVEELTTPLPEDSYVRLEPSYTFLAGGGGNTLLFTRALHTYHGWLVPGFGPAGALSGVRVDIGFQRIDSPTVHAIGLGKLGLAQASGMIYSWGSVGVGVAMALPTATNGAFGAGDLQVGPAMFGYVSAIPHAPMSLVVRTLFATGDSPPIATVLEPIVAYELSERFALTSNGQIDIDWFGHDERVPVNLRGGISIGDHWYVEAGPELVVVGSSRGELTLGIEADYFL